MTWQRGQPHQHVVDGLVGGGWGRMLEQWFRWFCQSQGYEVDQETVDGAVAAYLNCMARDVVEAMSRGD